MRTEKKTTDMKVTSMGMSIWGRRAGCDISGMEQCYSGLGYDGKMM